MRNVKYFLIVLLVTALQASFSPNASRGFEGRTHQRISELATQSSNLNNFLTSVLGFEFPQGINEPLFNGKRPIELIRDGSVDEDSPFFRTRSHFHDPTRAWNQAGLKQIFESSVLWSQNPNQGWGG